jgi:hypothetical protein
MKHAEGDGYEGPIGALICVALALVLLLII